MAGLDSTGDWMGRGARALDNPHTDTGEESLEKLYDLLDNLKEGGGRSRAFRALKGRIFLKQMDPPQKLFHIACTITLTAKVSKATSSPRGAV
ncbi:hypothetical protein K2173_012899 (mitochondrion) [Erythroxylum novogranatense]|uniref:DUF8018 domain-containing protein n=1 Tax=Erythroxylum novogranatense TaxID=1862640 RepID=A0AAV8S3X3_9ROSI|nr:hypothetical protein K2173_012899 [Erythroxylum novogranatense]